MKHKIISKYLNTNKADALFLATQLNRYWASGINSTEGYIIATKTKIYFLVDERYYEEVKNNKTINVIKCNSLEQLKSFIKSINIKTLLLEDSLTLGQVETLVKPLKVKTCNVNMQELRKVKTKEELVLLQKAADIAVATVEYVRKNIKVGMSEKEVAKMIYINMIKLGASGLSFDSIIAFGENSAIPHHAPNDRTLKKNEFITVDIGCIYKGYCSDITRTFVLGKPTQRMIDMYNLVFKAQAAGVNKIKAGMKGCDIDNICRTIISNNQTWGDMFIHGTGHGVGLEIHELPNVKPTYTGTLFENSVVTIEPGVYENGQYGVRIEDTVVVKNGKCVVLTKKANKNIIA